MKIVRLLNRTNAKLIWATTSAIPNGAEGRVKGSEVKYNTIVLKIMESNHIQIDDQYALTQKNPEDQMAGNVHFLEEGKIRQAKQVSNIILKSLE